MNAKTYDRIVGEVWQARDTDLAIDTETTGLHPHEGDVLRGVSVAYRLDGELRSHYVPLTHPDSENVSPVPLFGAIAGHRGRTLWWNGPFDWTYLVRAGCSLRKDKTYDGQVVQWLLDENQRVALKAASDRVLGAGSSDEQAGLKALNKERGYTKDDCWAQYTEADISEYAAKDTELTLRMAEWQETQLDDPDWPVRPAVAGAQRLQWALKNMMDTGIKLDEAKVAGHVVVAEQRMAEIVEMFDGVNLGSPKQLERLIYDEWGLPCYTRTATGGRSTSKEALEPLGAPVGEILEYRKLAKALQGFYRPMLERQGLDGRIHPHFSSTRTVTGRLSCSDPNLQTIPREDVLPGVRSCFVAEQGTELWGYDLASAELRVIAALTGETVMQEALEQGRDLHGETAEGVFGEGYTDLQRRLAKNMNFGAPYFIGANLLALYLAAGPPRVTVTKSLVDQAYNMLAAWKRTYPRLVGMMEALAQLAEVHKVMPLHTPGRYRRFKPGWKDGKPTSPRYYSALNFLVQGGIGALMNDLMLEIERDDKIPGRLCLQVHDEFVFEVDKGAGLVVQSHLQRMLEAINPFAIEMRFDASEWSAHA